jgi:putative DNA primase/helicase
MAKVNEIAVSLACGRTGCPCAATARSGKGLTHCPCTHNHSNGDATPSFSLGPGDRVDVVFRCHAGCSQEDVLDALRDRGLLHAVRDLNGDLVAMHERKGRWFTAAGQISRNGLVKPKELPLYGSERLQGAPGDPVLMTEGEKARDAAQRALKRAVVLATFGADAIPSEDVLAPLRDRRVFLWPDNDDAGREHMGRIGAILHELGCSEIRVVEWAGAPDKGDAADYLADHTPKELVELVKESKPWTPTTAHANGNTPHIEEPLAPEPADPMAVARDFFAWAYWPANQSPRLLWWRGSFYEWDGSAWIEVADPALRKRLYERLEKCCYLGIGRDGKPHRQPWKPNRTKVANVLEALQAVAGLPETVEERTWIEYRSYSGWCRATTSHHEPASRHQGGLIPVADGILKFEMAMVTHGDATPATAGLSRVLLPSSPLFFNLSSLSTSLTRAMEGDASPCVTTWLQLLSSLWPDDEDSIALLQEWFGYVVSGDTRMQKMLLMVGPPRSGKGTIARVLTAIAGKAHVANPTMSSLIGTFGLQPLIGRSLAVVGDARFGGREVGTAVERLLSISGEDYQTIDRKHKESWTGQLGVRFMLLSNELPRLGDVSGTIATRFLILEMTRSWLGQEDHELEERLMGELPAILLWALEGLERLHRQGRFTIPDASRDAAQTLMDYTSPMRAFVRERCVLGAFHEAGVEDAFAAWKEWCEQNGRQQPGTVQSFGRDIRAAVPGLRARASGHAGSGGRVYQGFRLRTASDADEELGEKAKVHIVQHGDRWSVVDAQGETLESFGTRDAARGWLGRHGDVYQEEG